jgi:hypothetical protein
MMVSAALAGCSSDGNFLSTASVGSETLASQQKVDPACAALIVNIDNLRREGSIEKLEKAAEGKSSSVQIKRAALAKQAELNKANAEYQAKCSAPLAKAQTAQAPAATAPKTN